MSANTQPQKSFLLRVVKGPDKGAAFKLVGTSVRIGRGPDNDVILTDPKASRSHAVINFTDQMVVIENLSSNSSTEVDGIKSPKSFLNPGVTIVIGNSHLKFEEVGANNGLKLISNPIANSLPNMMSPESGQPSPIMGGPQNNKTVFYIIVGLVIITFIWLMSENEEKKIETLTSEADIEKSIEESQKRQESLERQKSLSQRGTQQYTEANAAYLRGLRDYREGHYTRAMQSFSAALALFPGHELAQNYYNLARKRHDELVQFTFSEGQRYLEQNKYKEALVAFQNVMILINDSNNPTFKKASELYKESLLLQRSNE